MSDLTLTKTRLFEGVWEGVLSGESGGGAAPEIEVTHQQETIEGVEVIARAETGDWVVRVPVPPEKLMPTGCRHFSSATGRAVRFWTVSRFWRGMC